MATTVTLKPNAIDLSGSTSGVTTLQASAVAGTTTITLPAATDTLVGKATTDTLTNKTLTGAVMNGTVGATTPSTGAFTTLSATGVTTVQAGTAALPAITTTGDTNTGIFFPAADIIAFSEGGTESMRIDSSGNLLVGTTSGAGRLTIVSAGTTSASKGIQLNNFSGTELLAIVSDGSFFTGTAASSPYNLTTGSAANAFITSGGQLQRSTSSLKYKTDIQDATHGLADVLQLRPVTYKGTNDGEKVFGGLIAEEVHEAGLTEFVQYAEDGTPDALAYGNMVSLLTKAIQEQQALITSLTARITALEST